MRGSRLRLCRSRAAPATSPKSRDYRGPGARRARAASYRRSETLERFPGAGEPRSQAVIRELKAVGNLRALRLALTGRDRGSRS